MPRLDQPVEVAGSKRRSIVVCVMTAFWCDPVQRVVRSGDKAGTMCLCKCRAISLLSMNPQQ